MTDFGWKLKKPKPGDIWEMKTGTLREIIEVNGGDVTYRRLNSKGTAGALRFCWVSTWNANVKGLVYDAR